MRLLHLIYFDIVIFQYQVHSNHCSGFMVTDAVIQNN